MNGIGPGVDKIYVVDDACPEASGQTVLSEVKDPRIKVLFHEHNMGVGAAMITGYKMALEEGATVIVKLDGDGQMDPRLIEKLISPVVKGQADYVKGNRFYDLSYLQDMPFLRKVGNTALSFINKAVNGYWNIMDPTNGFTAVSASVLKLLPLDRIEKRFFFEQDMLFRLNTIRAVVQDFPMPAKYDDESSNLRIWKVLFGFPGKFLKRFIKRIFYSYFLRDFNIGSLELIMAVFLMGFGFIFGTIKWIQSINTMQPATAGTVILAGLPIILGFQAFLSFLHFDLSNIPQKPVSSFGD